MSKTWRDYVRQRYFNPYQAANALIYGGAGVGTYKYITNKMRNAGSKQLSVKLKQKPRKSSGAQKKPRLHQSARNIAGTGSSFSKFYYGKRKIPRAIRMNKRALQFNYVADNGAGRLTAPVGKQSATNILQMLTSTDLSTVSGYITALKTQKFYLDRVNADIQLTNQDLGNVKITLYDCIARRDSSAANLASPAAAWANSYADEAGSNTDYQIIGATPFSADLFVKFFKVCKVTHIVLGAGQGHVHKVRFAPHQIVDNEILQYQSQSIRGLTCFTFAVVQGMPANDATTKTSVSTGIAAVDYVFKRQIRYTFMSDSSVTWHVNNFLPTSFAVNESVMNAMTGAAVTDTTANEA